MMLAAIRTRKSIPPAASIADAARLRAERAKGSDAGFADWLREATANRDKEATVTDGLVAHFPLDETKGRVAVSKVGKHRGKVLGGDPAWVAGKFAGAADFDGKRFIEFDTLGDFERDQAFSYGAWVRWAGGPAGMAPLAKMNDADAHRGYDVGCCPDERSPVSHDPNPRRLPAESARPAGGGVDPHLP